MYICVDIYLTFEMHTDRVSFHCASDGRRAHMNTGIRAFPLCDSSTFSGRRRVRTLAAQRTLSQLIFNIIAGRKKKEAVTQGEQKEVWTV